MGDGCYYSSHVFEGVQLEQFGKVACEQEVVQGLKNISSVCLRVVSDIIVALLYPLQETDVVHFLDVVGLNQVVSVRYLVS